MRDGSRISRAGGSRCPKARRGPAPTMLTRRETWTGSDDYYNQQSDCATPPSISYPQSRSFPQAQVHSLMQQLEVRNEEVAELQRQLEMLETFDKNALFEQLQQARLGIRAWRKRAEAAERRVSVLECFTAQCRELEEAAFEETDNLIMRDDDNTQTRVNPSGAAQTSGLCGPGHVR
ncbi:hypothetical protein DL771_000690 [Monosporascus sp. 5C6A]|nr:hypothetical protein DL771_000690 [Monosporascus sp. 5C6A]